jgi:hypothetical protein
MFQYKIDKTAAFGRSNEILPGGVQIWHNISPRYFTKEQAERATEVILKALNDNAEYIGFDGVNAKKH